MFGVNHIIASIEYAVNCKFQNNNKAVHGGIPECVFVISNSATQCFIHLFIHKASGMGSVQLYLERRG